MKLGEIINATMAFQKLSNMDLRLALALSIKKLTANLQTEINFFEERRMKLLDKHGAVQENENTRKIPDNNIEAFQKDFKELLDTECSGTHEKIKLKLSEDIKLTVNDIIMLEPFIIFEE